MKPNVSWAAIALLVGCVDAIRVYEGTNFPAPITKVQKTTGFGKKSLYITKRSWGAGEEEPNKTRGKWKEADKRTGEGPPTLYKIKFADKNFMQYLRYIKDVPRLEEYTFCLWYKSENLTHDQTLFSYSLNKNEILLRFWINAFDSSLRMAIRENLVYKVPANVRERKWHHMCQSWNGVLGEWQVFLDGKKIGAGVIAHYKGTYIPEGGEVTLGQDLMALGKRLNDGMDGEVFGFNLVDESVPHDEGVFINSQYRPNVQAAAVPPFKKLPQIKKTYQEIKAYISALPPDPSEGRNKNEAFSDEGAANVIKKPKRNRNNHRIRYPPLRKVVVYNRDDRQLTLDEASVELNRTKPKNESLEEKPKTAEAPPPSRDGYSIHSYRGEKEGKKTANYEIYEVLEEEDVLPGGEDRLTERQLLERKARQNFDLYTAREAHKVYTLSNSLKGPKTPKFHFETRGEEGREAERGSNRRSFEGEESRAAGDAGRKPSDAIPVYEMEIGSARRKRTADGKRESRQFTTDDPLADSNGFRRLPRIPESFIELFTGNVSRSEMEEKLERFFPSTDATAEDSGAVAETTEPFKPIPEFQETVASSAVTDRPAPELATAEPPRPTFAPVPPAEGTREAFATLLGNPGPVSFPPGRQQYREFDPVEAKGPSAPPEAPAVERRKFEVSSGTDLVMRSYGECTADRGSPVRDKDRLVLSWADTPVRIFGGAQVERARNECGHF